MNILYRAIMECFLEEVVSVLVMEKTWKCREADFYQACEGKLIQSPPSPDREPRPPKRYLVLHQG